MDEPHFIDQTIDDIKRSIEDQSKLKRCVEFEGSLYEELKYRCSPDRYMNPYNPKMIDLAADLYAEVLKLDEYGDKEEHRKMRKKASDILGVKFSTRRLYDELRDQCHPENFTNPNNYNAEKVKLANAYFQKINDYCDDIDALEELEKDVKRCFFTQPRATESDDDTWGFITIFGLIVLATIGFLIIIAAQIVK